MDLVTILLILFIILFVISAYGNYNMIVKSEKLEEMVIYLQTFIIEFSNRLSSIDKSLEELDTRGTFAADDEVGYTFTTIKLIVSQLQEFNINYAEKKEE